MLKHGILGLLSYGSMTGYEINKAFKDSLSYFWNAQTSQIYRELQTLKQNGWATDKTVEQDGKPDKKLFTITDSGRAELNRWLTEDNTDITTRSPLMMKTFFRGERSVEENIAYFEALREGCDAFVARMTATPPDVDGYTKLVDDPMKAVYWRMTVEYGVMYAQMYRSWVENCKKELEAIRDEHPTD